jgi:dolichol-phosphate mannosyltransferase
VTDDLWSSAPVSVVVVLPTYNERENVERAVASVLACDAISRASGGTVRHMSAVGVVLACDCHPAVLVVDDNSPDGTGGIVRRLAGAEPDRVELLERAAKQGLGRAYAAGFDHVLSRGYDVVVQMDVDGSHNPADVDRLVSALTDADLALGSRYVPGVSGWTKGREWLSRGGNTYARLMLSSQVHDLTGGFKAWRADLLRGLNAASTASDGYAFQIEMTMRAVRAGGRVVEVPIVFRDREAGQSKMSGRIALEALLGVPGMRRSLR